jgi:hypothetical protein
MTVVVPLVPKRASQEGRRVAGSRRGQWPIAALNGSVAGVLLILVAVLALVVNPPAPPGVAAFAPQAAKQITKAPPAQKARFGDGNGECLAGQVCAHTSPSAKPTAGPTASLAPLPVPSNLGVPSALQCFTWPDGSVTQTFDPQSPPCMASWDDRKGNGGSTSPGVSATEIRVALPVNDALGPTYPGMKPIVDFLNSHYQFYGRKIRIVPFVSQTANEQTSPDNLNDPSMERADASQITQLKVFATTDFVDPIQYSWSLPVFRDILTKHKIVSVAGGEMTPYGTRAGMAAHAPYEWTYYPPIDTLLENYVAAVCRQLVGKPAVHSTDRALRSKTRKFAVALPSDQKLGGPMPGLSAMLRTLDGCGVHDPKVVRFSLTRDETASLTADFKQLKDDGVTSILYFPFTGASTPQSPPNTAAAAQFTPEWITAGWNNYLTASQLNGPQNQTDGMFGVGLWNLFLPPSEEFWVQAFIAGGGQPGDVQAGSFPGGRAFYNELLVLAAGIQLAGPNLTPETFAEGLTSTTFPNPGAAAAPFYQATVGFRPGDPAMTHDYLEFWLDTRMTGSEVSHTPNVNTYRAMCQVARGRRWNLETWPTTDLFYRPPCR